MKQLTAENKIDLIFNYIFSSEYHIKEEEFWNFLSDQDIEEIEEIKKEPTEELDFNKYKCSKS